MDPIRLLRLWRGRGKVKEREERWEGDGEEGSTTIHPNRP